MILDFCLPLRPPQTLHHHASSIRRTYYNCTTSLSSSTRPTTSIPLHIVLPTTNQRRIQPPTQHKNSNPGCWELKAVSAGGYAIKITVRLHLSQLRLMKRPNSSRLTYALENRPKDSTACLPFPLSNHKMLICTNNETVVNSVSIHFSLMFLMHIRFLIQS